MLVDEYGNEIQTSRSGKQQAASFDTMGKLLYHDPETGITVHRGNIFECKTVKGGWNLIIAFQRQNQWLIYGHGDRAKKVSFFEFIRAIESGDIIPRAATEIDPGRLDMAMIGLDSIANRRTAEETIMYAGDQAEERYNSGG